jgi:hypothetical protein
MAARITHRFRLESEPPGGNLTSRGAEGGRSGYYAPNVFVCVGKEIPAHGAEYQMFFQRLAILLG